MTGRTDESALDDPLELERRDPGEMLRAVATAGAQVREALLRIDRDQLGAVAGDGRPRALVVAGMGGSGVAGDMVSAVTGPACPVPVVAYKGATLPGWVGPVDVVVAVSCSGETQETLAVVDEAVRRGARVVTVGRAGSSLASRSEGGRTVHLPVETGGRSSRANLWALSVPPLLLADALGLTAVPRSALDQVADRLDVVAARCGPVSQTYENPGKLLALELAGHLPCLWGTSPLAGVAAHRMACQLAENAKHPSIEGVLPEVAHNQVVTLAGSFGSAGSADDLDLFRDRVEEDSPVRLRVVLLRDTEELDLVAAMSTTASDLASSYGVAMTELNAEGEHPLERLATLIAPGDFASVYLALAQGVDPSAIEPIVAMKERTHER